MRGPVEHVAIIIRIKNIKVVEYAGIDTNMNYQERNQEETCKRHHYFFANGGCEKV
jgi:hypothetical protein